MQNDTILSGLSTQVKDEEPDVNLPAAWRIDKFLDDYEDEKFDSLAKHKLEFLKVNPKSDAMATNFDDNYKVRLHLSGQNRAINFCGVAPREKPDTSFERQAP